MKKKLPKTDDFIGLVIDDIPLIDVRAPVEYQAGTFPGAANLPVMDNEDRHLVGLCYKKQGRDAAFALAFKRVSGKIKAERIEAWVNFHASHPDARFFCFRGGMRSKTAQQWFSEQTGIEVERLDGGYKAFRRFLIEALRPENIPATPVVLGGRTGCGKTPLLNELNNGIDLEGAANHRGSAFGAFLSPQPTQIDFENRLAYQIVKHKNLGFDYLVIEDEGSYIGGRYIPHDLAAYFKRDSMVLLERGLAERVEAIHNEYVTESQKEYRHHFGEDQILELWHTDIKAKLHRIRKRLGGQRLKKVTTLLAEGVREQQQYGTTNNHRKWVELLVCDYYDPMYDYQIEKSGRKISFRGEFHEVLEYLRSLEK